LRKKRIEKNKNSLQTEKRRKQTIESKNIKKASSKELAFFI
jgi:hypothetical protein